MKQYGGIARIVVALVLVLGAVGGLTAWLMTEGAQVVEAGPTDPDAGTVQAADLYTLYDAYTTTTTFEPSDVGRLRYYNSVELFVTADFSSTGTITVTPEYSVDGTNWITASYNYLNSGVKEADYQIVLNADGTDFVAMPMRGLYIRPAIEASNSNGVTVTVKALAKNN
jgi:hypothetical protein